MKINLEEAELVAAIQDWLKKTIPELLQEGAKVHLAELQAYPKGARIEITFVLPPVSSAEAEKAASSPASVTP